MTIALPKGRLYDKTQALLARCGYNLELGERRLVASESDDRLRAILVKNADLPTYVHHGIAGLGICGSDVIYESGFEFFELMSLPFGATRICLAGPKDGADVDLADGGPVRIASKYSRFTRDFFHARGVPVSVIHLNGSVELAPVLGLARYIVDLVETGSTLKAHELEVKEELGRTEVRFIANRAYYKYHFKEIEEFVAELRSAISSG
jgi:ATP phosphoribosyltransferase